MWWYPAWVLRILAYGTGTPSRIAKVEVKAMFESSKGHMRAIRPTGLCLSLSVSWELAGRMSEVKSRVGTDCADTAFNL